MFLSISLNCCPQYRSIISRLRVQLPNARWPGSGSVQPVCTAPLGSWNFRKFLTGIFVMERRPLIPTRIPHLRAFLADIVARVTLPFPRPLRLGSRGPSEFFLPAVSDTSPKCIDREGLRRRRTETKQVVACITVATVSENTRRKLSL